MKGDSDGQLIAHYLNRGHTLSELLNLRPSDRECYAAAMEVEMEAWSGK